MKGTRYLVQADIPTCLRFCHRSDGRHGFEKNISSCTGPTQLFQ